MYGQTLLTFIIIIVTSQLCNQYTFLINKFTVRRPLIGRMFSITQMCIRDSCNHVGQYCYVATVIQSQPPNPQQLNKPAGTADVATDIQSQPATPQLVTRRLVLLTFTPLSSRNLQLHSLQTSWLVLLTLIPICSRTLPLQSLLTRRLVLLTLPQLFSGNLHFYRL